MFIICKYRFSFSNIWLFELIFVPLPPKLITLTSNQKRFFGMKDRIKLIMEQQGCNQVAFAHMIGIAPATLSGIFNGRTQPTLATAKAIHDCFPAISLNWLMFGEGEMTGTASSASPLINNEDGLSFELPEGAAPSASAPSASAAPSSASAAQGPKQRRGDVVDTLVKNADKTERKISEIRVFFDDGTYEVYLSFKS